jgi:glycosyltransferase involved in cell wall biosynthesis
MPFIPYVTPAVSTPLHVHERKEDFAVVAAQAEALIAPSAAIRAALLRNGAPPERVLLIPHGVPLDAPAPLPARTIGEAVRFLYLGRLSRAKGLHVLIDAFNRITGPAELHIIGQAANKAEKRYWNSVVRRITRPSAVIQHGYLNGHRLREVMAACDVLVLPTIVLEVFGLAIAEAHALGRPVITTDSGGTAEQVRDGVDGLVVRPNDPEDLAKAMRRIVEEPGLAAFMAQNIRTPVSIEKHLDELERLYARLVSKGKRDTGRAPGASAP